MLMVIIHSAVLLLLLYRSTCPNTEQVANNPRLTAPPPVSYKQYAQQLARDEQAQQVRSRPLSGASRLAQVGSNVVEDHLGHATYAQDPAGFASPVGDGNINPSSDSAAMNEYDDILDALLPTPAGIDYSKYGL